MKSAQAVGSETALPRINFARHIFSDLNAALRKEWLVTNGCIAQAWSVAEPLRAYIEDVLLKRMGVIRNMNLSGEELRKKVYEAAKLRLEELKRTCSV